MTTQYRVEPAGEFIVGLCLGRSYYLRRARTKSLVLPGQLVVLDPSTAHSGSPAEDGPWEGRLLVIELPDLRDAALEDGNALRDFDFPEPRVGDEQLARRFLSLHLLMQRPASTLEQQAQLYSFLQDLAALAPDHRAGTRHKARLDPAVRHACDYLRVDVTRNTSLDELAVAARTTKFRLVRLFKAAFGVPPHAFQVGQRVILARQLIERGLALVDVAEAAGFVDQSHLHRHFHRRLGMTPGQYARAVGQAGLRRREEDHGDQR